MNDVHWFKTVVEPRLKCYDIKYKFFAKGDFESLNSIEFKATFEYYVEKTF